MIAHVHNRPLSTVVSAAALSTRGGELEPHLAHLHHGIFGEKTPLARKKLTSNDSSNNMWRQLCAEIRADVGKPFTRIVLVANIFEYMIKKINTWSTI